MDEYRLIRIQLGIQQLEDTYFFFSQVYTFSMHRNIFIPLIRSSTIRHHMSASNAPIIRLNFIFNQVPGKISKGKYITNHPAMLNKIFNVFGMKYSEERVIYRTNATLRIGTRFSEKLKSSIQIQIIFNGILLRPQIILSLTQEIKKS